MRAEQAGFSFLFVSDHFHPWSREQGHGSSLWPVLGALAASTHRVRLISAVTCPFFRLHITALAQAAATVARLSQGRFVLGLGTGERLNEQVVGKGWPPFAERLAWLEEAVEALRALLSGEEVSRKGRFLTVERAQLFDPWPGLPLALASSGPRSATLAARRGDALIGLGGDPDVLQAFLQAGGERKPRWTQLSVCWAPDAAQARRIAHRLWPVVALEGTQFARLATPQEVEEACRSVSEEEVAAAVVCASDPEPFREVIDTALEAGYDGVALHPLGPDQEGFFRFWESALRPHYD